MKLAVIYCTYDLPKYIHKSLNPWINLKNELGIGIFGVHGLFKENFENGVKDEDFETQQELLKLRFEDKIDWLYLQNNYDAPSVARKYEKEAEIRDYACQEILSRGGYTHLMILDGDEIYTEQEIRNIHNYVDDNKFVAWFSLEFRNLTFSDTQYTKGFIPPRIFSLSTGPFQIKKIYWDNDIVYVSKSDQSAIDYKLLASEKIPVRLCNPKHLTWNDFDRSCVKIRYQEQHFGHCGFEINKEEKRIQFSESFHKKHGILIPELFSIDE